MNREIKYRAWLKRSQTLAEVISISFVNEVVKVHHWEFGESIWLDFDEVELLEYIGRKDEDGEEIYEEDILTIVEQGYRMGYYYEDEFVGVVKYDDEQCTFKLELINFKRGGENIPDEIDGIPISHGDDSEVAEYWFNEHIIDADIKILGNTFQSPELLKGENHAENE